MSKHSLSDGYQAYMNALEAAAKADPADGQWHIQVHNNVFLPGILQSPELVLASLGVNPGSAIPKDVRYKLRQRQTMLAQQAFTKGTLRFDALVPVAVMNRWLLFWGVQPHLQQMVQDYPDLDLRVIPDTVLYEGLEMCWYLLESPEGTVQLAVAQADIASGTHRLVLVTDEDAVGKYQGFFAQGQACALERETTAYLLQR